MSGKCICKTHLFITLQLSVPTKGFTEVIILENHVKDHLGTIF